MAKTISKTILIFLVLVLVAIWTEIVKSPVDSSLHIYFLNVGQGDAELIQKGEYQILIDGGPNASVLTEVGKLIPKQDRKIEVVILTHPHADHLVGLNLILERYEVGKIYMSGVSHTSNQYLEFLSKIKDKKIEAEVPEVNQTVPTIDNAALTFLWPGKKFVGMNSCTETSGDSDNQGMAAVSGCIDNLNNTSQVVKFCYLDQCSIFTGDLQIEGQTEMFVNNKEADYHASILKIAHHGSNNGTDATLMEKVLPGYAVIEVGADNKYGHPHTKVLEFLNKIRTFRTDRDGTISFSVDQTGISTQSGDE